MIGIGFYRDYPFAIPLNIKYRLSVPKYNPYIELIHPDGLCGFRRNYVAICPIESPGDYQLFGRTISA
ncbi:unnamed protein product [Adineta steineri]|uniref:Uncharacterized protein n=1 Tax=Adineta steineri TaxID=433720 RepID=A0A814C7N8_9BILA|nr:unnamed protein product [Adineta steineri]CAF3998132.1 unnamed protein product [Adineta steineri]